MPWRRVLLLLLLPLLSFARGSLSGYCTQGGQKVFQNGQPSTTQVMQSYPQCLVTVYNTGGPSGTVTTSNQSVTYSGGNLFNANGQWNSQFIVINSVFYQIQTVSSPTTLTLFTSAGTQPAVAYSLQPTTPAAIFTANGTALANPFTASTKGYWQFYGDNGQYDIALSGGTIPSPFTWGAQSLIDPNSLSNTVSDLSCPASSLGCLATLCATAVSLHRTLLMSQMWDFNGTCAASIYAFSGGGFAPSSGHVTTLSGPFAGDLTQHFKTSIAGPGSVLLTGNTPQVYPNWFGAKMDALNQTCPASCTDDTAAWQGAIASLLGPGQMGGTVAMPGGVTTFTATGIVASLGGQFLRIVGQGNSSVIRCTGVACLQFTGTNAKGSGAQDLAILDPIGNASTIGLYLNGENVLGGLMTNMSFSNMFIQGNGNLQCGSPVVFCGLGVGVENKSATLNRFDNLTVQYFRTAVLEFGEAPYFFSSSYWTRSYFYGSGQHGWDIESSGDHVASQSDFEGNTGDGIYCGIHSNGANITQSHFESNRLHAIELSVGSGCVLRSSSNVYAGDDVLVDTGSAVFISDADDLEIDLITNSTGGGSHLTGATITNPFLGPYTITGTGCSVLLQRGVTQAVGPGCSINNDVSGYLRYTVDKEFRASSDTSAGGGAQITAKDLNTADTHVCYAFAPSQAAYSAFPPQLCWESGIGTGGFDFYPNFAIVGGFPYSFRNAAGSALLRISDDGTWAIANWKLPGLPLSCSGNPTGTVWNNAGVMSICP